MGKWDYSLSPNLVGDEGLLLGSLDPNGTLLTDVEASSQSGGDPYYYTFELRGVPESCSVQNPTPDPGPYFFTIPLSGTREIEFVVTCSP